MSNIFKSGIHVWFALNISPLKCCWSFGFSGRLMTLTTVEMRWTPLSLTRDWLDDWKAITWLTVLVKYYTELNPSNIKQIFCRMQISTTWSSQLRFPTEMQYWIGRGINSMCRGVCCPCGQRPEISSLCCLYLALCWNVECVCSA